MCSIKKIMKQALLTTIALALAVNTNAQITLNSGSYPASLTGTDSLKATVAASAFPSFTAMANGTWDLSSVTDSTAVLYAYRVPSSSYQFADSNFYSFSTYAYQGNVQSANTSTGLMEYGIDVQLAAYSLTAVTSGPSDSIVIPVQSTLYSAPKTKIAFPATNLSTWMSVYHFDFNFVISVAFAALTSAPGVVRTYTKEQDTVIGWGKMRVKNLVGGASNWYDVLQVKTVTSSVDSFFISGVPASPTLLSALGLTQAQVTKTYEQNYYRTMEVTPFANVQFSDSTYATPTKATTHAQRLVNVGVDELNNQLSVSVYPNPVTANKVTITLPAISGSWSYELVNLNGQVVTNGSLAVVGTEATIAIPAYVANGTYYIRLNNNGNQYSVKAIEIAK